MSVERSCPFHTGMDRTTLDRYWDWKNEFHNHFLKNGGDDDRGELDLSRALRSVPPNMNDQV